MDIPNIQIQEQQEQLNWPLSESLIPGDIRQADKKQISPFQNRIDEANQLKKQGNQHFKNKQYDQAKTLYHEAIGLLDPSTFTGATQLQCVKMAEASSSILFNIGSCFFCQKKWVQADLLYTQAITINPRYFKAIYKRAMSRYYKGEYESAMTDIKQAFAMDKANKEIHEGYELILLKYNEIKKIEHQKIKEMNSKIFGAKVSQKKISSQTSIEGNEKDKLNKNWWGLVAFVPLVAVSAYQVFKLLRTA